MEFSPPEKMPKNSPSYLIWSIFTREREERRMRAKEKKLANNVYSAAGNSSGSRPAVGQQQQAGTAAEEHATQAERSRDTASPLSKVNLQSNDDLTYQSTLLHMRVVGELPRLVKCF